MFCTGMPSRRQSSRRFTPAWATTATASASVWVMAFQIGQARARQSAKLSPPGGR